MWSGQLSVVNQAQLSFNATVVGGAGDWAELLPDSQVTAHLLPMLEWSTVQMACAQYTICAILSLGMSDLIRGSGYCSLEPGRNVTKSCGR